MVGVFDYGIHNQDGILNVGHRPLVVVAFWALTFFTSILVLAFCGHWRFDVGILT